MFKVQDNWPIPPIKRAPKNPRRKFPVHDMKLGQMFFMPRRSARSVSSYISRITKDLPGSYAVRQCFAAQCVDGSWVEVDEDYPGATKGVGVWRIE